MAEGSRRFAAAGQGRIAAPSPTRLTGESRPAVSLPSRRSFGAACADDMQGSEIPEERRATAVATLATNCIVAEPCLKRATTIESAEMSQITDLEAQLAEAFDRLRNTLAAKAAAARPQPG